VDAAIEQSLLQKYFSEYGTDSEKYRKNFRIATLFCTISAYSNAQRPPCRAKKPSKKISQSTV